MILKVCSIFSYLLIYLLQIVLNKISFDVEHFYVLKELTFPNTNSSKKVSRYVSIFVYFQSFAVYVYFWIFIFLWQFYSIFFTSNVFLYTLLLTVNKEIIAKVKVIVGAIITCSSDKSRTFEKCSIRNMLTRNRDTGNNQMHNHSFCEIKSF